jgi:hypothetical protein
MVTLDLKDLLMQILAGGMLGILGQGLRAVAGMKKVNDAAAACGKSFGDVFDMSRFVISLFIGFTAGALALVLAETSVADLKIDKAQITAIIAAGYAGTDFIQAFLAKSTPALAPAPEAPPAPPPAMG